MTSEEWQRVKAVSAAALEQPESERRAYIAAASGGDVELAREVQWLLASMVQASGLFESSAFSLASAAAEIVSQTHRLENAGQSIRHTRTSSHTFEPGHVINGRYLVESLAGKGGMGSVYRVFDSAARRTLALKVLGGTVRSLSLFKIEFRTLVELRHPHLARSYDFEPIADGDECCFTMDFVDGVNIFEAAASGPWTQALDLVVQLCRALAYIHNRGVVHRDIKPNNVLVQRDGIVKLLDFGLAGTGDELLEAMGTPSYLAPEIRGTNRGDHRSDLYSLGVLMFQLLTGAVPFVGIDITDLMRQHAYAPVSWPDGSTVPLWLRDVVDELCAKQPSDRPRGANQVIEAINQRGGLHYPVDTAATRESYVVSGRFVGRRSELNAVSDFVKARLSAASSTIAPFLFIVGASGVGKSRLMRELRHQVQLDRQRFVEGHCFEGATAEYGAWAEALSQLVPLAIASDAGDLVEQHAGELVKIAPDVAQRSAVVPVAHLATAEAERARLFDAVASFVVESSARFPFVLFVDDAQWASHGTIEMLQYVRRHIAVAEGRGARRRVAIVVACRSEEATGRPVESLLADDPKGDATLRLAPLAAEAMERLLVSMFGLDSIPPAFVSRVLEDAAGSPFFLEEVVRGLVENGSVFVEHGAWQTASALGELEIPQTIVAALRRRLATIESEATLELLRLLAAYKKPMSASLLAAAADTSTEQIEEALYDLALRHMVTVVNSPERLFRTAHDHLRTTVYHDMSDEARGVHLQIAKGLERIADADHPQLSELAHHYWAANDTDRALRYALLAGRAASRIYANDETIEHLEHALQLLPSHARERSEAQEQLADAYFLSGRYERTRSLLAELDRNTVGTLDKVRLLRKRAEVVGYSAGTPGEAVDILWQAAGQLGATRPLSRAMFLTRTVGALTWHLAQRSARSMIKPAKSDAERHRLAELAAIYLRIGYFSFFYDPVLFGLPVLRAANLVDRIPDSSEYSQVYSICSLVVAGVGMNRSAIQYGREAIDQAARSGSTWLLGNAESFHSMILLQTGQWTDALAHAGRAHEKFTACGDHFQLAIAAVHVSEVLQARGHLAAARARAQDDVAVFERLGLQMIGKGLYTEFGRLLAKTGDERGIAIGRDVLARAEGGFDKLSTVFAEVALGDALLHLGRYDEAIEHLEHGLAIRDRGRFDLYVVAQGSALLVQAYTARIRETKESCTGPRRREFERRVKQAVNAGRRFSPMRSAGSVSRALACHLAGGHDEATRWFDEAVRHAASLGATLWEADAHLEHGLSLTNTIGVRRRRARAELELARTLYHSCGAVPAERRANEAMSQLPA